MFVKYKVKDNKLWKCILRGKYIVKGLILYLKKKKKKDI